MLPAMPSASTVCLRSSPSAAATPAAAPIAPNTAVGWKPALCTAFGTTRLSRHSTSTPTAMPRSAAAPSGLCRSQAASTAGTTTAPACTGPPSNVSSKSSPCAAVPLTSAAPAALKVRAWPIAVHGPSSSQPASVACDVVLVARRDAQADHVDAQGRCISRARPAGTSSAAMRSARCSATEISGSALMCCAGARRRRSPGCG